MPVYWSYERSAIIVKLSEALDLNLKPPGWISQVTPLCLAKIAKKIIPVPPSFNSLLEIVIVMFKAHFLYVALSLSRNFHVVYYKAENPAFVSL